MLVRLGTFILLLNAKLKRLADIDDDISVVESHFSKLATMDSEVAEPMKDVIWIRLLSEPPGICGHDCSISYDVCRPSEVGSNYNNTNSKAGGG